MGRGFRRPLRDYLKTDFGIDFSAKNRNSLHEFLGFEIVTYYNPDEAGLHRLVLLTKSGSPHEWNESLPADWLPSSVSETDLVVLVGPERETDLDSSTYRAGSGPSDRVTRYRFEMDVEVREARTGHTVMRTTTVRGSEPGPFPVQLPAGETRIDGGRVTNRELIAWLTCYVIMPRVCEMRTLEGHEQIVTSMAFSPDRQTLASGSWDTTVRLWRVSDGALLHTLEEHTGFVNSVAFSPDGQILASGSNTTVYLWRVSDGVLLRTLEGHTEIVNSVAFSPDGQTLASGADENVRLWQVSDGALLRTLEGHKNPVTSVAFSPDGQTLASGAMGILNDDNVRLWRVSDGALLRTLERHTGGVTSVAFSPDGQTLASGARGFDDDYVRLWLIQ